MADQYFRKLVIEYAKSVNGPFTTYDVHQWIKERNRNVPPLASLSNYLARYVEFEHIGKNTYVLRGTVYES